MMYLKHIIIFYLYFAINDVSCTSSWVSVSLIGYQDYFKKVMTETAHRLEDLEWCNLKIDDQEITINELMYNWHVTGKATYSNGFVVSIEHLELFEIAEQINTRTVDGRQNTIATVHGKLNFKHMNIGYDVKAELSDGDRMFTGIYDHEKVWFQFWIQKNLNSNEFTVECTLLYLSSENTDRMMYLPANNISEVLSRSYVPSRIFFSVNRWCTNVFNPIVLDIASNKVKFPEVCLSDC